MRIYRGNIILPLLTLFLLLAVFGLSPQGCYGQEEEEEDGGHMIPKGRPRAGKPPSKPRPSRQRPERDDDEGKVVV